MKKNLKKFLLLFLVFSLLLSGTFSFAEARTIDEIEADIGSYEDLLDKYDSDISKFQSLLYELSNELSDISGNINELKNQTGQTTELLMQYQAEIEALQLQIDANTLILESYEFKRSNLMAEMAGVKSDYEYRVSMYKKLMQFIYENSDTNSFELLFSSKNISEYLTRRDNFNDIMNAANELIKEIQASMADMEELDAEYAEAQSKYDSHLIQLNQSKLDRENRVKEFETTAERLGLDIEELNSQYYSKNTKVSEIRNQLNTLKSERANIESILEELEAELEEAMLPDMSGQGYVWPVKNCYYVMTSYFGWRSDPFTGETKYHNGHDIACARGTPVLAAKGGIVTMASEFGGYGNCVIIYHGNGISTLYAHLDWGNSWYNTFEVKVGDLVQTGDLIAHVGTSGRSTGYHLHFGVLAGSSSSGFSGYYDDPDYYLPEYYSSGYC